MIDSGGKERVSIDLFGGFLYEWIIKMGASQVILYKKRIFWSEILL